VPQASAAGQTWNRFLGHSRRIDGRFSLRPLPSRQRTSAVSAPHRTASQPPQPRYPTRNLCPEKRERHVPQVVFNPMPDVSPPRFRAGVLRAPLAKHHSPRGVFFPPEKTPFSLPNQRAGLHQQPCHEGKKKKKKKRKNASFQQFLLHGPGGRISQPSGVFRGGRGGGRNGKIKRRKSMAKKKAAGAENPDRHG